MKSVSIVMAAVAAAAILPGVARGDYSGAEPKLERVLERQDPRLNAIVEALKAENTLLGGFQDLQKSLQERLASYDAYRAQHAQVISRLLALGFVMESPDLITLKGNPQQTHRLTWSKDGRLVLYVTIQGSSPSSHLRGEGHIMYRATLRGESLQGAKSFRSLNEFRDLTNDLGDIEKIVRGEGSANFSGSDNNARVKWEKIKGEFQTAVLLEPDPDKKADLEERLADVALDVAVLGRPR